MHDTISALHQKRVSIDQNKKQCEETMTKIETLRFRETCKLSLDQLHKAIIKKTLTPSYILNCFIQRCKELHSLNCICEFIFDSISTAASIDVNQASSSNINKLIGIPISVKDSIKIEGLDTSLSLIKFCNMPAERDATLVEVLYENNALPFVKTCMGFTELSMNSSNLLFGEQKNPRYKDHVAGGGSGGEGILVSLDGSPLGLSVDCVGSILYPAAFNDTCALKATHRRLSTKETFMPLDPPALHFKPVVGMIARKVSDIAFFMQNILCERHFHLDPRVANIPFKKNVYDGKTKESLKIGYYTCFKEKKLIRVTPSVKRGVTKAVRILSSKGHEMIEIKLPKISSAFRLALLAINHDGGEAFEHYLSEEPADNNARTDVISSKFPTIHQKISSDMPSWYSGPQVHLYTHTETGLSSASEAAFLLKEIEAYKKEFFDSIAHLDAIVCPLMPVPIPKIETNDIYNIISCCYGILYNLLDLPAGVVPVDRTNQEDVDEAKVLAKEFLDLGNQADFHFHSNQTVEGLPLSVQVVSKPFCEETVLRVMKLLEEESEFERIIPF